MAGSIPSHTCWLSLLSFSWFSIVLNYIRVGSLRKTSSTSDLVETVFITVCDFCTMPQQTVRHLFPSIWGTKCNIMLLLSNTFIKLMNYNLVPIYMSFILVYLFTLIDIILLPIIVNVLFESTAWIEWWLACLTWM